MITFLILDIKVNVVWGLIIELYTWLDLVVGTNSDKHESFFWDL